MSNQDAHFVAVIGAGPAGKPSLGRGLLFATLSGLGSALVNFGLAFGGPLVAAAQNAGAQQTWAPNAVWLPLMVTGGVVWPFEGSARLCAEMVTVALGEGANWGAVYSPV